MIRSRIPLLLSCLAASLPALAFEDLPAYSPPPGAAAVRQHPLPEQFSAIEKGAWQEARPEVAPLTDALVAAAGAGDAERVRKLIAEGALPNAADLRGERALCAAVAVGALEATRILLQRGADPNLKGVQGRPPLAIAAANGQRKIVGLLLRADADVDRAGANRATPLHEAVRFGHATIVADLLAAGADAERFNTLGQHPLALAASLGQLASIEALIAAGVPPDLADRKGLTALHWSRRDQQALAEALLLEHGARREAWPLIPR